jgi:hypothetical protein
VEPNREIIEAWMRRQRYTEEEAERVSWWRKLFGG